MKISYRKQEPTIHVFISWVEFCLRAPAQSPIHAAAAGLRGELWRPSHCRLAWHCLTASDPNVTDLDLPFPVIPSHPLSIHASSQLDCGR